MAIGDPTNQLPPGVYPPPPAYVAPIAPAPADAIRIVATETQLIAWNAAVNGRVYCILMTTVALVFAFIDQMDYRQYALAALVSAGSIGVAHLSDVTRSSVWQWVSMSLACMAPVLFLLAVMW